MNIGGTNLLSGVRNLDYCEKNYSYFITKSPSIWGWATWRDRWKYFDEKMKDWSKFRISNIKRKELSVPGNKSVHITCISATIKFV